MLNFKQKKKLKFGAYNLLVRYHQITCMCIQDYTILLFFFFFVYQ